MLYYRYPDGPKEPQRMLLSNLDLLFNNPVHFLALLPGLLLTTGVALVTAITIHEFSHALVAYRLGDTTAQRLGRVSLNPMRHLDPLGTAMVLLVGFGWGKPTPVNPLRMKNPLQGMTLVSIAGPISNLALASLLAVPLRLEWIPLPGELASAPNIFSGDLPATLGTIFLFALYINVVLAVFNLIPVAPLDGFKVVQGLLPAEPRRVFSQSERYGPALLMGVILLDFALHVGILGRLIFPPIQFFVTLMLGL